jgi:hypothetical protein
MVPKTCISSEAFVNRNLDTEKPGLPQDSSDDKDGANYLRRLKGSGAEKGLAETTEQEAGKMAAAMTTLGFKERRQSPRLRCSGSVEFQTAGSEARMWGTLTDISLHGCYVEMSNTFPVDTKVRLVLKSCGLRFQVAGTVRASYPDWAWVSASRKSRATNNRTWRNSFRSCLGTSLFPIFARRG